MLTRMLSFVWVQCCAALGHPRLLSDCKYNTVSVEQSPYFTSLIVCASELRQINQTFIHSSNWFLRGRLLQCHTNDNLVHTQLKSTWTPRGGRTSAGFSTPNQVRDLNQESFLDGLTTTTINMRSHTAVLVARKGPHPVVSGSNTVVCPILTPTACTNADLAGI